MEISTGRLRIASNLAVESPPQKTMVLTRTNGIQSTASSTTNSTNKSNVNGMISFETRGSTSFDAREKKLGNKYAHKVTRKSKCYYFSESGSLFKFKLTLFFFFFSYRVEIMAGMNSSCSSDQLLSSWQNHRPE